MRHRGRRLWLILYWTEFNRDVLVLDVSRLLQTLVKRLNKIRGVGRDPPDDRQHRLLRVHSEQQNGN